MEELRNLLKASYPEGPPPGSGISKLRKSDLLERCKTMLAGSAVEASVSEEVSSAKIASMSSTVACRVRKWWAPSSHPKYSQIAIIAFLGWRAPQKS